jgi:hypothetical protein
VAAKAVSVVQSGITVAWANATAWPNWMTIVTALASATGFIPATCGFTFDFTDPCNLIWAPK